MTDTKNLLAIVTFRVRKFEKDGVNTFETDIDGTDRQDFNQADKAKALFAVNEYASILGYKVSDITEKWK